MKALGFQLLPATRLENSVPWAHEQFVAYLLTQSNVIAHVELGNQSIEEVADWLAQETAPFFEGQEQLTLLFWTKVEGLIANSLML